MKKMMLMMMKTHFTKEYSIVNKLESKNIII